MFTLFLRLLAPLSCALAACATPASPEDAEHDPIISDDIKSDSVWFVEDNSWDSEAVLRLVNSASFEALEAIGLTEWPARAIADAPKPIKTLTELDDLAWAGPLTFEKLRSYVVDHPWWGPKLGEEYPPHGEAEAITSTLMSMSSVALKNHLTGQPMRRGQHAKAHACAQATFTVDDNVPVALRAGVFASSGRFRSTVRFSNGDSTVKADAEKDVRGFAIKLMGVPGPKLLAEEATAETQDFLLINHPELMIRNVLTYADFVERASSSDQASILGFFLSLNPFDWELRGLTTLLAMISHEVANPLDAQYFSTTPYRLGDAAVKYSARPCATPPAPEVPDAPPANYLRTALASSLRTGSACFDFMVQVQTDPRAMPIEDPTVPWDQEVSPFVKIARLEIPSQTVDTAELNQACENLAFTPWHSLEAHRPLGGINRARKAVYRAISVMRRTRNGASQTEPR